MIRFFLLFYITIAVIYSGCKKDSNTSLDNQIRNPFFDSALQFLKSKLSNDEYSKLDLKSNKILRYRNQNLGIQFFENGSSHDKFLLLNVHSGNYAANWVDLSGLGPIHSSSQSGFINLESLDRETNAKLIIDNNEVIKIYKSGAKISGTITVDPGQGNFLTDDQFESNTTSRTEVKPEMLPEVVVVCDACAAEGESQSCFSPSAA